MKKRKKEAKKKPGKRFSVVAVILLIFLLIRFIAHVAGVFITLEDVFTTVIYSVFSIAYLAGFIGVLLKKKYGSVIVIVIAIIDLISALFVGGAAGIGAGIYDLILLFLACREYKNLSKKTKK
jgi:hypothetical protein